MNPEPTFIPLQPGERTVAEALGLEVGQAYTFLCNDGSVICWSIDMALRVIGDRPTDPNFNIDLRNAALAIKCNNLAHELDQRYALITDLTKPVIAIHSPFEEATDGRIPLLIIDGWHRILKVVMLYGIYGKISEPLRCHVMTREEELQCRIRRIG